MSWLCWACRRRIERAAAAGGGDRIREDRHAAGCTRCREYQLEVAGMTASLRGLATNEELPLAFEQSVWRRIDEAQSLKSRPAFRLSPSVAVMALAVAAGAALVLLDRQPDRPPSGPTVATVIEPPKSRMLKSSVQERVVMSTGSSKSKNRVKAQKPWRPSVQFARRDAASTSRVRRHRVRPTAPRLAADQKSKRQKSQQVATKTEKKPIVPPQHVVWAAWGAWYENRGDFGRAAEAYERAELAAQKSPAALPVTYSYDAGRAAENAGDMSSAVEFYSKMLSRASGSEKTEGPKTEKGTHLWIPSGDTA